MSIFRKVLEGLRTEDPGVLHAAAGDHKGLHHLHLKVLGVVILGLGGMMLSMIWYWPGISLVALGLVCVFVFLVRDPTYRRIESAARGRRRKR